MARAVIIGGGIIGLSSAYYLHRSGWEVVLIDQGDFTNNCSYGNAGYICPSHFIPLATPGLVWQGLKWMLDSSSPFYIKPRASKALIEWGYHFIKSATAQKVSAAAIPLRDIAFLSKRLYEEWLALPGFEFAYQRRGLLELFQTPEKESHAHHTADAANELGINAEIITAEAVQRMEPTTPMNIKGALYFAGDAHLHPGMVMQQMGKFLRAEGVKFLPNTKVNAVLKQEGRASGVSTATENIDADLVVIATGAWSREMAAAVGESIPLVGGRGYSVTLQDSGLSLRHPAVLMEGRVALTPFSENSLRIGGTMEITKLDAAPNPRRVAGILKAVQQYYPAAKLQMPNMQEVWTGFRPCSADGMPFIGRAKLKNCIIATGHAMVGMSLGAATGKLVSELANEQPASVDLSPYAVGRFR